MEPESDYEAIVIGAGMAGMTAALWLGRFRRRTLLLSAGPSRNAAAHALHGYPGFDGAPPSRLMDALGHELTQYPSVTRAEGRVDTAAQDGERFCVSVGRREYTASRILLATGIRDIKPELPEFDVYEGVSIWHCPACDGHEYADKKLAILGSGAHLGGYVRELIPYTDQLSVVTNGSERCRSPRMTEMPSSATVSRCTRNPSTACTDRRDSSRRSSSTTAQPSRWTPSSSPSGTHRGLSSSSSWAARWVRTG